MTLHVILKFAYSFILLQSRAYDSLIVDESWRKLHNQALSP